MLSWAIGFVVSLLLGMRGRGASRRELL